MSLVPPLTMLPNEVQLCRLLRDNFMFIAANRSVDVVVVANATHGRRLCKHVCAFLTYMSKNLPTQEVVLKIPSNVSMTEWWD
jgi:hypothetical protein